jgi:hypothetical protein
MAVVMAAGLLIAGCGSDDDGGSAAGSVSNADPSGDSSGGVDGDSDDSSDGGGDAPATGGGGGTINLGGEEIAIERLLCFFQEQPRAGLGGVFTHTAQGEGVNAAGEGVLLDFTRAVAEDGTIEFDLTVTVGDFLSGDSVELRDTGDEITFGDNSASVNTEVTDFDNEPLALSFDLPCG